MGAKSCGGCLYNNGKRGTVLDSNTILGGVGFMDDMLAKYLLNCGRPVHL